MKKAISLLLGVLLICSLSGFTHASDPYRAYTNAANRVYKAGAMESTLIDSTHVTYSDGTTDYGYRRALNRDLGYGPDMQSISEVEELILGGFCKSTSYHTNGWYYEKIHNDYTFQSTGTDNYRRQYLPEDFETSFWFLAYDYIGSERLDASMFSFGSTNDTIRIRVPREQANDWMAAHLSEDVAAGARVDQMEVIVTLDDKGRIAQEDLTTQFYYPDDERGWAHVTRNMRTFFTWPADKTPIAFPDDLDTYVIVPRE